MKFNHLAQMFYEWGWRIPHEHYVPFSDYVKEMLKRNRVLIITEDTTIIAILFYYLTDDYTLIYKKGTWDTARDSDYGHQIYIDKMVCKKFNREILRSIKSSIESHFPNVTVGVYHRAPYDKCVKIYTERNKYEIQG